MCTRCVCVCVCSFVAGTPVALSEGVQAPIERLPHKQSTRAASLLAYSHNPDTDADVAPTRGLLGAALVRQWRKPGACLLRVACDRACQSHMQNAMQVARVASCA
jgi:hypothetical protein